MPPTAISDWHYLVFFLAGVFFFGLLGLAAFLVWDWRARRRETALRMAALRTAVRLPEALRPQARPAALVEAIAAMDAERGERRAG